MASLADVPPLGVDTSTWAAAVVSGDCHDRDGRTPFPVGAPSAASSQGRTREEAISEFVTHLLKQGLL
eukprot:12401751-Heterocapsa_arctica.AAC.1